MSAEFAYDTIAYPSFMFPQTHPDRLATMAKVYGLHPAPIENCRVLELGCGDGSNLLAIASSLPDAEFVGIDLSVQHIERAREAVRALELTNVEFEQRDILELEPRSLSQFDYIITHGLYSWVPETVREKVLTLYRELLPPHGVGFISYNALPGNYMRQMMREMMLYHVSDFTEPEQRISQAITILGFLSEAAPDNTAYKAVLREELETVLERDQTTVFHDELADVNTAFYFVDFVEQIAKHDLRYLAEADITTMQTSAFPAEVRQVLNNIPDPIKREQYLDFVRCRRFRQTLVRQSEANLEQQFDPVRLHEFWIVGQMHSSDDASAVATNEVMRFTGTTGLQVAIDHPLTKAVLIELERRGTQPVQFSELLRAAREHLSADNAGEFEHPQHQLMTAAFILHCFKNGLIKLHTVKFNFLAEAGERPQSSRLARWQAQRGYLATAALNNTRFEFTDELERHLLGLLDGTRTREDLSAELKQWIESDHAKLDRAEKENLLDRLPALLEERLAQFAEAALLTA